MTFGQILQVVLSLAVVGLALYLATRVARRRFGTVGEPAMKLVARQSVERGQNLVVVEFAGRRHLIALTAGGATHLDDTEAPAPEQPAGVAVLNQREPLVRSWVPGLKVADDGSAKSRFLQHRPGGTQWSGLGKGVDYAEALAATKPETPKWTYPREAGKPAPKPEDPGSDFAAKLAAAQANPGADN